MTDRVASLAALLEKSLGAVKAIAGIARLTNPETLSADADYWEKLGDEIEAELARGAAQGLGEPPGNVVNLTRLIHEAESRWSAFAAHGLTRAEFAAIELHRQGVRAGHPERET